jgi:transposase InsO family protein
VKPLNKTQAILHVLKDNAFKKLPIEYICKLINHTRSSYYAGLHTLAYREKKRQEDEAYLHKFKLWWKKFPGLGYEKLARYVDIGKHRAARILQEFKGARVRVIVKIKPPKRLNVLKSITNALVNSTDKLARGNWILKDGKNKYRKIILPTRPFQLWTGDWKELKLSFLPITIYIFLIIDAHTRIITGWSIGVVKDSSVALKAAKRAVAAHVDNPLFKPRQLIMHTDQGSAYIAQDYIKYWRDLGVKVSWAAPGKPTQNPWSEGIISLLSRFCLHHFEFDSVYEADTVIGRWISDYNNHWLHSNTGDNLTPNGRLAALA